MKVIVLLVVLFAVLATAQNPTLFTVLQDPATTEASVVFTDTKGTPVAISAEHWKFRFPLVEVTTNTNKKNVNVITFPTDADPASTATLFTFDYSGNVTSKVVSKQLQFFDLQYSPTQDALYGIAVTSPYGRALSRFTATADSVTATQIKDLPYMWFVNASTYDVKNNIYYGLLNNFPGQPNSTTAQKLAVGNYADMANPSVTFIDLVHMDNNTDAVVKFVAYAPSLRTLFGLVQDGNGGVCLSTVDVVKGTVFCLIGSKGMNAGPMVVDNAEGVAYAWIHAASGDRELIAYDIMNLSASIVASTNDGKIVAAMSLAH